MNQDKDQDQINILIVDDKPANLLALESILENREWNVIRAISAQEALGHLLRKEFACVLMDVLMPGMDGFEVAKIIRNREATRHLPLLFVSGNKIEDQDVFSGYELGAVDYLVKPLVPTIVRSKVIFFVELFKKDMVIRKNSLLLAQAATTANALVKERTSELTQTNEELNRSNAELDQFAMVASHDLQEPLRTIRVSCEALREKYLEHLDADAQEYLDFAIKGAERMSHLVKGLLEFSRISRSRIEMETCDLNNIVHEIMETLDSKIKHLGAEVHLDLFPILIAHPFQVKQLFQNLIANALKFTSATNPKISINVKEEKEHWVFSVKDNGIGIDEKYFDRIFVIFQRLHRREEFEGSGIGLSICKRIVEQHGGKIWVESKPQEGATFFFTLPKRELNSIPQTKKNDELILDEAA